MRNYTHILYHGNCYDGFGAALCAWLALGDGAQYIPVLYGQAPPALPPEAKVLIVDFSYPREQLIEIHRSVDLLRVLDHHVTAQEALAGLPWATFDLSKSGAVLAYEHFFPATAQAQPDIGLWPFVMYLQDRDLWTFELPSSREVAAALRAYPFDFCVWEALASRRFANLAAEGEAVLRHQDQMVKIMCEQAVWVVLGGHSVPVVNATVFFSEVGEELCKRFPEAPFAGYYLDRADGVRQWGLRSRNGFDTSVVAKMYGGGGHAGASGFATKVPEVL